MSDQIILKQGKTPTDDSTEGTMKTDERSVACPMQGKGRFEGLLGVTICCGAPLLLIPAISFFGLSLGAIASGALSVVALLACSVGMLLMMRMMMKGKKEDQTSRQ